jgi:hypothetical protein
MDADFNAGSMFGLCLDAFPSDRRRAGKGPDTLSRVIKAGFLSGVALKALSSNSEKYHFPTNRVMSFYGGCINSLTHVGRLSNFDNMNDGNDYYGDFITGIRVPLLRSLKKSSLKYFAGTEKEIEDDYRNLIHITAPLRDKLKDGPLKKLTVPVMSPS